MHTVLNLPMRLDELIDRCGGVGTVEKIVALFAGRFPAADALAFNHRDAG